MSTANTLAKTRSLFRLSLSAALFLAAGVAWIGQAETAGPASASWHTPISAEVPLKRPCVGHDV